MLPFRKIAPKPPTDTSTAGAAGTPDVPPSYSNDPQSDVDETLQSQPLSSIPENPESDVDEPFQTQPLRSIPENPQSDVDGPLQTQPLRPKPTGSANPLGQTDGSPGSSRRDSSVPGQSRPLKRKSGDDVDALRPSGGLVVTTITESPTSNARAVPAAGSVSPRTVPAGSNWRQETRISNEMEREEYDATVDDWWGAKRTKLDNDPAQEEQNNAYPSLEAGQDVNDEEDKEVQAASNSATTASKAEDDLKDSDEDVPFEDGEDEDDRQDSDEDAILPAGPPIPPPMVRVDDCTLIISIEPRGSLIMKHSNLLGSGAILPPYIAFANHPHILDNLRIRFLKHGTPINAITTYSYTLPRDLCRDTLALKYFVDLIGNYGQRYEAKTGLFGSLQVWKSWPEWQNVKNANGKACANCLEWGYSESGTYVRTCVWMDENGITFPCEWCSNGFEPCIVPIDGYPTVLEAMEEVGATEKDDDILWWRHGVADATLVL
jgi:hypothetical protein